MLSFFDLLARHTPNIPTREALLLIGLQNDLLSPDGASLADSNPGYHSRIADLARNLRPHAELVWVRYEYTPNRLPLPGEIDDICDTVTKLDDNSRQKASSIDEELFLQRRIPGERYCLSGSEGADFDPRVKSLLKPHDTQVVGYRYSAFKSTSLLSTLRSRFVTKIYLCGALSNISVYATACDAARHGFETVLIEDCLAYRRRDRHELAIKRLQQYAVATLLTAEEVLHSLRRESKAAARNDDHDDRHDHDDRNVHGEYDDQDDLTASIKGLEVDSEGSEDEVSLPTALPRSCGRRVAMSPDSDHKPKETPIASDKPNRTRVHKRQRLLSAASSTSRSQQVIVRSRDDQKSISTSGSMARMADSSTHSSSPTRQIPLFGQDKLGESAGSTMTFNLLELTIADKAFNEIQAEVQWGRMLHQTGEVPRLVCCQGSVDRAGSMPVYRHPSDRTIVITPWTKTIDMLRQAAEKLAGHPLNHGLIQLYRGGNDFISEHSDKTLDIVPGSTIVNVSLGAERTMRLRSKRTANSTKLAATRTTHRVRMPHNSMLSMSLATNAEFLHGINADKRPRSELNDAELAFDGQRISLTFRRIGTFVSANSKLIWGQGAISKTRDAARPSVSADEAQSQRLIKAFGVENQSSSIDWNAWYGEGSDVLHLR